MLPLLSKNLNICFSIAKRPILHLSSSAAVAATMAATTSSSAPINFNTYINSTATGDSTMKSISDADSDMLEAAATPDFATIQASHRFFFSSPGQSNSIVDSSSASAESEESLSSESDDARMEETAGGAVAVQTYSPDPYGDFRRSMEEMVEARGLHDVTKSWTSLHELLLCYLSLNPKTAHKFIVAAFSDLLISLLSPPQDSGVHRAGSCGCSCD